jgi:hypothetical protein
MMNVIKSGVLILSVVVLASCANKAKKDAAPGAAKPTAETEAKKEIAKAKAAVGAGVVTCTHAKDVRTIEVVAKDGGCEVKYSKAGKTTSPASSKAGDKFCHDKAAKMKTHLEGSGFKCEG